MARTVTVSVDELPDVSATLHDDGTYEVSITGITGLLDRTRDLTRQESDAGIVSANPPTVRTDEVDQIPLLILQAVEVAMPEGLLSNVEGIDGTIDREQALLAQLTRVVRRALITLEPPT